MNKKILKDYVRLLKAENQELSMGYTVMKENRDSWSEHYDEQCFELDFAISVLEDQIFDLEDEVETSSTCINCNYFDCTADSECKGIFKEEEE